MNTVVDLGRWPIGRRVAYLRHARGFSQTELAGLVGRSKSWMEKVERGVRQLDRVSVIRELATALRVAPQDILCGDELAVSR